MSYISLFTRIIHWYAVLHYPEFPESCDPIIPLAAQELMRKMIRQFAVEYAHKIQTVENQNAITQTEPDGPLDLTLSRNTPCAQQGNQHTCTHTKRTCKNKTVYVLDQNTLLFCILSSLNSMSLHLYLPSYWMCDYVSVTRFMQLFFVNPPQHIHYLCAWFIQLHVQISACCLGSY